MKEQLKMVLYSLLAILLFPLLLIGIIVVMAINNKEMDDEEARKEKDAHERYMKYLRSKDCK